MAMRTLTFLLPKISPKVGRLKNTIKIFNSPTHYTPMHTFCTENEHKLLISETTQPPIPYAYSGAIAQLSSQAFKITF